MWLALLWHAVLLSTHVWKSLKSLYSVSVYIYISIKCPSSVDDVVPHDEPLADENVFNYTGDEW